MTTTQIARLTNTAQNLIQRYHRGITLEQAHVELSDVLMPFAVETIGGPEAATVALDAAVALNHPAFVKELLDAGANPDGAAFSGYGPDSGACPLDTAIHDHFDMGSAFIIIMLLMAGVTPDRRRTGLTLLHALARGGQLLGPDPDRERCFHWMVAAGWVVDARAPDGATPLIAAASLGNHHAVKALIEQGADVHAVDHHGYNALDEALYGLQGGFEDQYGPCRDALVAAGGKPGATSLDDRDGKREQTHNAHDRIVLCIEDRRDLSDVADLLDKETHLESRVSPEGGTPLIVAVQHGNLDAVEFLMRRGANLNTVDHNGLNALDHAVGAARHCRCELLIQGAKATGTVVAKRRRRS
ncbi:ankyrin repeat domain-containing protein [Burkholderia gladioli]|uniref:ankyrin repeat domain-containing protein n=1 Tax=Burkholderia gladioli TaxID=28095 RepID=UPI0016401CD2|nr:ankyrin repeat domain-containing protein [Burkholderia gladioli]